MSRQQPRTGSDAKSHIVAPSGETLASELGLTEQPERVMRSTGDSSEALDRVEIARVGDQPMDDDYLSMMAFMNEDIEIRVTETSDPQAEQVFEININGKLELFRRGETKKVKRYFADRLLRMKTTRYSQKEVVNSEGIKDILQIPHTSLKYDFSIVRDANPLSHAWRTAVAAEMG